LIYHQNSYKILIVLLNHILIELNRDIFSMYYLLAVMSLDP
jgi:hypothetical protein